MFILQGIEYVNGIQKEIDVHLKELNKIAANYRLLIRIDCAASSYPLVQRKLFCDLAVNLNMRTLIASLLFQSHGFCETFRSIYSGKSIY